MKRPDYAYFVLLLGVLTVSFGAIFTRYAQVEAPSLAIAAYRMALAFVVIFLPSCLRNRHELRSLSRRDVKLAVASGFFLAVHFATWIYSLELTSIAISVVLVNTAPLWVGLLTVVATRESLSKSKVLSILIAVVGAGLIGWDFASGQAGFKSFMGGALAVAGAIALAAYLLIGRSLQKRVSLIAYVTACYGTAACFLLLAALITQQQILGFSWSTWGHIIGLAVVCQVVGHSANNYALQFLSASMISVALLGEPILSTLYAFVLFHETLTSLQAAGAAMILLGIYLGIRAE